jgi:phosphate transport system permease protein
MGFIALYYLQETIFVFYHKLCSMKRTVLAETLLFLGVGITLLLPLAVLVLFSMRTQHFDQAFDMREVVILFTNLAPQASAGSPGWTWLALIGLWGFPISLLLGLSAALWMSEYTPRNTRRWLRNYFGIQAAIPPSIYGLGLLLLLGRSPVGESEGTFRLLLIFVLMTVPLCAHLMEDAVRTVPRSLRNAAYALGASKAQIAFRVVLPSSQNRIFKGSLLALTRILGECVLLGIATGLIGDIGLSVLLLLSLAFLLNLFFILTKSS